jgi:hypothetical protein
MPQVVSAGISTNATRPSNGGDTTLEILGSGALEKPVARSNFISPEYFPLLHIPVTQGRVWSRDEIMRGAALAVINQTMARQYWPSGDAIDRQFRFANLKDEPPYSPAAVGADGWLQIIGVVADARHDGLRNPIKDMEDVSAGVLPDLRAFLPLWVKRLQRFRSSKDEWETEHERWLREAVFRADDVGGLERIARKTKRPQACLAWYEALVDQGDWTAALKACDAAARLVRQSLQATALRSRRAARRVVRRLCAQEPRGRDLSVSFFLRELVNALM